MSASKVMTMVVTMRPKLAERIVAMKEEGVSNEKIARVIRKETKLEVGHEVVRRWFKDREEAQ
jgi:intein-encoded DNA endonuclease-like protein